ncbi:MAG TPA: metallophosphoesterase [candidate division Zixibacteria bacterium]|nr:metallophosphoesterase [candidate division Zixibacteria bacterium]
MSNDSRKKIDNYSSLILPNKPAIVFNEKEYGKTLVISDLHIGYLYGKNKRGIIVPSSESPEEDLLKLNEEISSDRLIILGDFKDEIFGGTHPLAGRIWQFLNKLLEKTTVTIIKGNHDGKIEELLPEEVELIQPSGLQLKEIVHNKNIGLWHGHASPALDVISSDVTISGHAHPAYSFRDEIGSKITEKVWVKANWLNTNGSNQKRIHLIMPAFNRYIDGYSVDGEYFKMTVIMKEAINFQEAEVFTLDGVLIGTIKELQDSRNILMDTIKQRRISEKNLRKKKK